MAGSYRDLIAWQKAMALVTEVYRVTENFPQREMYGLTRQVRVVRVAPTDLVGPPSEPIRFTVRRPGREMILGPAPPCRCASRNAGDEEQAFAHGVTRAPWLV